MRNSIAIKLTASLGLLLLLFVIAAAMSFWESRSVTKQVRQIVEVEEPKIITANQLDITSLGTGMAVMKYLQTPKQEFRQLVEKNIADFSRLEEEYRVMVESEEQQLLIDRAGALYKEYSGLGVTLLDQLDIQDELLLAMGANVIALDQIMQTQKQILESQVLAGDGQYSQKLVDLTTIQVEVASVGAAVVGYVVAPRRGQKEMVQSLIDDKTNAAFQAVNNYANRELSSVDSQFIETTSRILSDVSDQNRLIVDLANDSDEKLSAFLGLRDDLDAVLIDGILPIAVANLAESEAELQRIGSQSNEVVLFLLFAGLATGVAAAALVTKSITGPVSALVVAARRAALGDLSVRVNVTSKDELGMLGTAFNDMLSERELAEEALITGAEEQQRLANQNVVNATLGRIISSSLDVNDVYDAFASEVGWLLSYDRLVITSLDTEMDMMTVDYVSGIDVPTRRPGTVLPLSGAFYVDMVRHRKASLANGDNRYNKYEISKPLADAGIKSMLGVPLVSRDRVIGLLAFSSKAPNAYSEADIETAQHVADQIGGALANAAIYAQHQKAQEELRLAHEDLEERVMARTTELEEARDLALGATQAKSQFLATMSHELRTPLNAVIGYSELLEELALEKGDVESIPDLMRINSSGKHLLGLVNNILDLAKIESGRTELNLDTFNIASLVGEAAHICENLAEQNGNNLEVICPEDIGWMRADETKVRQAVCNVLGNACKFTENGQISLTVHRDLADGREWVNFTVTDNGIGMTSDVMYKLFEPFTQADSSTSRVYGGSGLGLTLTRRFCHAMGGDIAVVSGAGQGSSFVISLPAYVPDPMVAEPVQSKHETQLGFGRAEKTTYVVKRRAQESQAPPVTDVTSA